MTNKSDQNQEWLNNRPMWAIDKLNKELCKHPKRWLAHASPDRVGSSVRMGWLDMPSVIRANEIANSKKKRKKISKTA